MLIASCDSMTVKSMWCPVIGSHVACVSTLEGEIAAVICSEYDAANRLCNRRSALRTAGPLSRLLERLSEETLDDATTRCVLTS